MRTLVDAASESPVFASDLIDRDVAASALEARELRLLAYAVGDHLPIELALEVATAATPVAAARNARIRAAGVGRLGPAGYSPAYARSSISRSGTPSRRASTRLIGSTGPCRSRVAVPIGPEPVA
jgi:hypothetical protein